MKNFILAGIFVMALASIVFAVDSDIEKHSSCTYCGMDRAKYAYSRILIEYDDGTSFGACSLHCAAVDLANNIDKEPRAIGVGDYNSKKLIDAESANWVLGGKKPGVMTMNAKWAFEDKHVAEKFIKENGGMLVTFDDAIKAAYEDMYKDTKQIRERRKMKRSLKP
ncbi:MAG: nitrous oxide reductase accessory protein NosL [Desulfuromonadaceae bacterium]|nr:nitrous oxide reductase accessory protein NosL [Desulfuromonadaceae bacterium]